MNIDDLTIKQAKELSQMFGEAPLITVSPHIGKKCIIRTYASGVHFGELVSQNDRVVELKNARRLWRWDAAPHGISLSEVSIHGSCGGRSRICEKVERISILDALEVIPCTNIATNVIEGAKVFTP